MLIKQIIDGDIAGCRHALEADEQLKEMEEKYYTIMSQCPEEVTFDMESTINAYIARVIRIAYLQGIKDFANLYIALKEDVHEILQKCE